MRTTNWKYGARAVQTPDVALRLHAQVQRPLMPEFAQETVGLQLHRRQMAHTSVVATRVMHYGEDQHLSLRNRARLRWEELRDREVVRKLQGGLSPWYMAACKNIVSSVGRAR